MGQTYTLDVYRYLIYVACVSHGKPWLDGKIAIPNDLQHFPDGLHPNDLGHDALASYLRNALTQLGWLP